MLALHAANLRYTTLFTAAFYLRGHVTLDCKSLECHRPDAQVQWYGSSVSLPLQPLLVPVSDFVRFRQAGWNFMGCSGV
jgi:hypothetical protein